MILGPLLAIIIKLYLIYDCCIVQFLVLTLLPGIASLEGVGFLVAMEVVGLTGVGATSSPGRKNGNGPVN